MSPGDLAGVAGREARRSRLRLLGRTLRRQRTDESKPLRAHENSARPPRRTRLGTAHRRAFETGSDCVVERFQKRQRDPVGVGKADGKEQSPDRGDGTDVLRVREDRERESAHPGNAAAEAVAVEDAGRSEPIEDGNVEALTHCDQNRAQCQRA